MVERAPPPRGEGGTGWDHTPNDDTTVAFSRGADKFDAYPEQRSAPSFEDFADAILRDRSARKGQAWFSAPFKANSDGRHHRCKDGALPRRFLAFDLDGGTRQGFVDLGMYLAGFRGFGYTSASHTTGNPHSRHVLELSRPVDRDDGVRLGQALQQRIEARVGSRAVKLDPSAYRGEQPLYGPLVGADVMRYDGEPIDVDEVLKDVLPLKERPGRTERAAAIASGDPVVRALAEREMVKRDHGNGKVSVACPFESSHTEPGGESSTIYYLPNFAGVKYGKFVCLHQHCNGREQEDFLSPLGLAPKDVWRAQAGGAAPSALPLLKAYDDDAAREEARRRTAGDGAAPREGGNAGRPKAHRRPHRF